MFTIRKADYAQAREEFAIGAIATVEELRGRVAGDEQQQQQFFQTMLSPYHQMIKLSIKKRNLPRLLATPNALRAARCSIPLRPGA